MERAREIFRDLPKAIKDWYIGPYVPGPYHPNIFFAGGHQPHWTARVAQRLAQFWLAHWRFLVSTAVAIAAIIVAATR